jgi:hypothetical protein
VKIVYWSVIAWVAADLVLDVAAGDGWRTLGFAIALVCALALRRELTEDSTS